MRKRLSMPSLFTTVCLFALTGSAAHATIINLQAAGVQGTGQLFSTAGDAKTLTITAGGYDVVLSGGTPLGPGISFLPASDSILYGTNDNSTASASEIGYTNPLSIAFFNPGTLTPANVTNFFVDLYNGNTVPVDYTIASNVGGAETFSIGSNFSGGQHTFGLASGGSLFTVFGGAAPGGCCGYDYFINDIGFNQAQPGLSPVPLPATAPLFGAALLALGAAGYGMRRRKKDGSPNFAAA